MRTISSGAAVRCVPIGSSGVRERAQFVLFGQRQRGDLVETADRAVRREAGALELVAIEARALEQMLDLLADRAARRARAWFSHGADFDLRFDHGISAAASRRRYASIASSPLAAR